MTEENDKEIKQTIEEITQQEKQTINPSRLDLGIKLLLMMLICVVVVLVMVTNNRRIALQDLAEAMGFEEAHQIVEYCQICQDLVDSGELLKINVGGTSP